MLDPRGVRFAAAITTAVFALVILLAPGPVAMLLLALQTLVFASGALLGPSAQPYGWLFRKAVRPRLGAPKELEEPLPVQFSQAVGLVFALGASACALAAWTPGIWAFSGLALFAAFLNAAFGFCLGCEMYLRIRRFIPESALPTAPAAPQVESVVNLTETRTRV